MVGRAGENYVGTVQGVIDRSGLGMIQNLGIVPEARNLGLGTSLLLQSLGGFRRCGIERGMLEVTADNIGAVRLYRRSASSSSDALQGGE